MQTLGGAKKVWFKFEDMKWRTGALACPPYSRILIEAGHHKHACNRFKKYFGIHPEARIKRKLPYSITCCSTLELVSLSARNALCSSGRIPSPNMQDFIDSDEVVVIPLDVTYDYQSDRPKAPEPVIVNGSVIVRIKENGDIVVS